VIVDNFDRWLQINRAPSRPSCGSTATTYNEQRKVRCDQCGGIDGQSCRHPPDNAVPPICRKSFLAMCGAGTPALSQTCLSSPEWPGEPTTGACIVTGDSDKGSQCLATDAPSSERWVGNALLYRPKGSMSTPTNTTRHLSDRSTKAPTAKLDVFEICYFEYDPPHSVAFPAT
jgi:hypothetical protein